MSLTINDESVAVASAPVRIFDTFLFDGELDLLEHRLRQNFDHTDFFVLVEAGETYRGEKKAFCYGENRARFAWAAEKIRAVSVRDLGHTGSSPHARAEAQRNAIVLGFEGGLPDDVVLILDADEIPSVALLQSLRREGLAEPHRLAMTRHYQRIDLVAPASTCCVDRNLPFAWARPRLRAPAWEALGPTWSGRSGVAAPLRTFQRAGAASPFALRFGPTVERVLSDAGRHLTAVDPSAQLSRKLRRVFHAEWATDRGLYGPHLLRCERHAVHHRGWWYAERPAGKLPADLAGLGEQCPATRRTDAMPTYVQRRLVRTWAWLRLLKWVPDRLVRFVDDHFEQMVPVLALPLLCADVSRSVAGMLPHSRSTKLALDGHAHH